MVALSRATAAEAGASVMRYCRKPLGLLGGPLVPRSWATRVLACNCPVDAADFTAMSDDESASGWLPPAGRYSDVPTAPTKKFGPAWIFGLEPSMKMRYRP